MYFPFTSAESSVWQRYIIIVEVIEPTKCTNILTCIGVCRKFQCILTDGINWYAIKLFMPWNLLSFFGEATTHVNGWSAGFHIGPSDVSCMIDIYYYSYVLNTSLWPGSSLAFVGFKLNRALLYYYNIFVCTWKYMAHLQE